MNLIDSLVGYFAPHTALKRMAAREAYNKIRSNAQYAAAKSGRLIGNWNPTPMPVNYVVGSSAAPVRERVRQLVRDFPYFHKAINVLCDYMVGSGIKLNSRVKGNDGLHNTALIQKIEDAFNRWNEEADASGRLSFYELMKLSKRQELECGEFILVRNYIKDKKRFMPLCYQIYEPDWLSNINAQAQGPNGWIDHGVEFNVLTGQVLAYHLYNPSTQYTGGFMAFGYPTRIDADRVIHGYETLRPMQLRGISPFASAVLVAHDLSDYMDAEMDAAKMAAKYLAFVKTGDAYGRQFNLPTDEDNKAIDALENGIIEYLRPGEDITIATNPRPGTNFPPFVRLILCMLSVATGVPYELISGDNSGLNYSTAKIVRTDFRTAIKPSTDRLIRQFCTPILWDFLDCAVLTGKLDLPGYMNNPWPYREVLWQPPGMEAIDPLRETKAHIDEMSVGLRSPQEIAQSRGRSLEDIYTELDAAHKLAKSMGLTIFDTPSTALANNPAAINNMQGT